MDKTFAAETKALMDGARLCAIDLGSNVISTIHLFLADCKTDNNYSIRSFAFRTEESFEQFFESQRVTERSLLDSIMDISLPITIELEQTIRNAVKKFKSDEAIMPYHLFLSACKLQQTILYSILTPKEGLYDRLVKYYVSKGLEMEKIAEKKGFWQRLK